MLGRFVIGIQHCEENTRKVEEGVNMKHRGSAKIEQNDSWIYCGVH